MRPRLTVAIAVGLAVFGYLSQNDVGRVIAAQQTSAVRPRVTTSEGITLLEHDASAFDRAPRVVASSRPITVINDSDIQPGFELTWLSGVVPLEDGRIVALAGWGRTILLFDSNGRPLKSLARNGRGPGEIMAGSGLIPADGDTVIIRDGGNQRVNWLTTNGVLSGRPRCRCLVVSTQ
jgi:hypothetical protein